ncbi:phosphodiesterase [Xanthobacter sp. V3C-3]|uniref:phosphodiesterase n=1 Tax=Xanthobacter lutulentifluminis TaxID=3119935 RepID=UPI00372CD549
MLMAQITDFHVTPAGRLAGAVDTRTAFTALVDHLARLAPRPDLLIVSGDLGEVGVEEEYAFVREGLERLAIPFLAVPGNHDRRAPMRAVFGARHDDPSAVFGARHDDPSAVFGARHDDPSAVFGAQHDDPSAVFGAQHDDPSAAFGAGSIHLGVVRDMGALRIIGLDTLVEGHSHGAIAGDQLAWLAAALEGAADRKVLIVMHHPPFVTGIPAMDAIGLREGRAELEALLRGRANILGILCGHVHRAIVGSFAGHRAFIAPSASHQFALDFAGAGFRVVREAPQIALHRVEDGALVTCLVPGPALSW